MAEVIATFAALSSFLQVVEFTAKVGSHALELIESESHALADHAETAKLAQEYESLATASAAIDSVSGSTKEIAKECNQESEKLLRQLEGLKISPDSRGVKRIRDGTVKAFKGLDQRKDIEKRRRHLLELNSQLTTSLLQLALTRQDGRDTQMLALLRRLAEENDQKTIERLAKKEREKIQRTNEQILQNLRFDVMKDRENFIEQAYPKTYGWALTKKSLGFRSWLQSGSGIYWISGKAASGKSTLMKFLFKSQETRRLLSNWCGEHQTLVLASFYFWFPGSSLQKSVRGLLQSVLHQILSERPELSSVAFPNAYSDEHGAPSDRLSFSWTYEDLLGALYRIVDHGKQDSALTVCKKFCLFIDGLDEYHGNHLELVNLLRELAGNADFKLCVSSRPWNAFRNAFESSVPNMRLEDLTRPDIHRFVDERIRATCSWSRRPMYTVEKDVVALINDIVSRAEGVFLWVYLVLKSVLNGIAELEDIAFLRQRVQTFPADLDEFFRTILSRADEVYRVQTHQALKLAVSYASEGGPAEKISSWVDFWLLKQNLLAETTFPYKLSILQLSSAQLVTMVEETRLFLSAACKDLLWIPKSDNIQDYDPSLEVHTTVQFLHRTVYDFLCQEPMQKTLSQHIPSHFEDSRIFHLLNLARLTFIVPEYPYQTASASITEMAKMSIATAHTSLCSDYVERFEALALQRRKLCTLFGSHQWILEPSVLAALLGFKRLEYVTAVLDAMSISHQGQNPWISHHGINVILVSALGGDPITRFGLHETDLGMVELLLRAGMNLKNSIDLPCYSNTWRWLLQEIERSRGLTSVRQIENQPLESHGFRHVWHVVSLFLQFVDRSLLIHMLPMIDDNGHRRAKESTGNFLKRIIPWEWRKALGDKRLLD